MVELKDVNEFLLEHGLRSADIPFLSTDPGRIAFLAFQPQGAIVAAQDSLVAEEKARLGEQMVAFLRLAVSNSIDLALCPEYSCPWDALISSVQAGLFPREGALWALCCESLTPQELQQRVQRLAELGLKVLQPQVPIGSGRFFNLLCYLFHSIDTDGRNVRVALLQAKTFPMGGTVYERDALIPGNHIFRFGKNNENRLVCLICSDVLGPDVRDTIVPELQSNTLLVHLQLNTDSAAAGFRDYRDRCCFIAPRTTEIFCLNWAMGTTLKRGAAYDPLVTEPKTIYYRTTEGLGGNDGEIVANHRKGCFLSYWSEQRTAAFIFHPEAQVFQFKASKPLMLGAAPAVQRSAPRMEARYVWTDSRWQEEVQDADDKFIANFLAANPQAAAHLAPYTEKHVDLERLMQFGTGFGLDASWFEWQKLRSFKLERDDTSARLRICWSSDGVGAEHRTECHRRFKALVAVLDDSSHLPARLAAFRGADVKLVYESAPLFRRFRNIYANNTHGTVVYMGADPGERALANAKDQLEKRLYDYDQDRHILSVLYRNEFGALIDYMDNTPPAINDDPGGDPVGISTV